MQRLIALAAAVGLALFGLTGEVDAADAAGYLVTVKGHVLAPNGKGIAGVRVKVRSRPRFSSQLTTVDARTSRTGRYEVEVPNAAGDSGGYQVFAWDPGRTDTIRTDGKWAPVRRRVVTDAAPVVVDLQMGLGAGLSGRLTDAAGRPVRKGLAVSALPTKALPLYRTGLTYTTAGGRYRFTNLPAGPTSVCFAAIKPTTVDRCYTGRPGGSPSSADATRFDLVSGRTLSGVDFQYPKVQGGISGTALLDGGPIDSDEHFAHVDLLDASGEQIESLITSEEFAFREVKAGTYYLRIHGGGELGAELGSEFYEDAETLAAATPITVKPGQDVKGILLDLTSD